MPAPSKVNINLINPEATTKETHYVPQFHGRLRINEGALRVIKNILEAPKIVYSEHKSLPLKRILKLQDVRTGVDFYLPFMRIK